jgi:hypothetical protein
MSLRYTPAPCGAPLPRPPSRPECQRLDRYGQCQTGWVEALLWVVLMSVVPMAGASGAECHVSLELADARGRPGRRVVHEMRVGEVLRPFAATLLRVRNAGPHDVRLGFVGLPPRVLQRGQTEPDQGVLARRVRLRRMECLATRAVPFGALQLPRSGVPLIWYGQRVPSTTDWPSASRPGSTRALATPGSSRTGQPHRARSIEALVALDLQGDLSCPVALRP